MAALLGAGCGGELDRCPELIAAAAPHLTAFERFVAVAERVAGADSAFAERGQLEESLFASVRGEPAILGAWVERSGAAPLAVAHPARAARPDLPLTTCRAPGGARIVVGRATLRIDDEPGPALIVQRTVPRPPQALTVTVAFVE